MKIPMFFLNFSFSSFQTHTNRVSFYIMHCNGARVNSDGQI